VSFRSFELHPDLLKGIKDLGFVQPTPIQAAAIPPAIAGRDLLACAMTGSGKTAAFLVPILHRLMGRPRGTTRALVLAPTRELAAQILEELGAIATHTPITAAAIFGGVGMGPQEHALRTGVDVVIATPGRLLDHLKHPYAKLDRIEHLVLDEADRMLDMGFLPDIRRVLRHLPARRQTLLFSATMPGPIAALARELLHTPATIDIERRSAPAVGITQAAYPVPQGLKSALLLTLLERNIMREALVFTRTKHRANRLWEFLRKHGISAARIHGNRSQAQRTDALAGFKRGDYRVLVATDIAARGIDIEALGHVVNFDVPVAPEAYIHRVGRTARAEMTGEAFTFVAPEESDQLRAIERAVGAPLPRVTIPDFAYDAKPAGQLEIPIAERLAQHRALRTEARKRREAKEERARSTQGSGSRAAPQAAPAPAPSRPAARPATSRSDPSSRSGSAAGTAPARRKRRRRRGPRKPRPE
jgi:ATP-dependent RNA helicase RhlE